VDRHRFDADPDPTFDADRDPDWHQNNADPLADTIPNFIQVEKSSKIVLLLFLVMPVYNAFLFSSVANVSLNIFGSGSGYLGCRSGSQTGSAK
jgi:hypothetical protein